MKDEEVKEILDTQRRIGVEVFVTDARYVPLYLNKLFVVDTKGRIAWEVITGSSNEIVTITATSDPEATNKYNRIFQELLELAGTQSYPPDGRQGDVTGKMNPEA